MTYELAKQLKDAGYPQLYREGMGYFDRNGNYNESACSEYNNDMDWSICEPTLSELIEACGNSFLSLDLNNDGTWSATHYTEMVKENG